LSGDSERPRRVELEKEGLIQNSHRNRPSPSGLPCIVWVHSRHATWPVERSPALRPPRSGVVAAAFSVA
jgi:hypothetical protein